MNPDLTYLYNVAKQAQTELSEITLPQFPRSLQFRCCPAGLIPHASYPTLYQDKGDPYLLLQEGYSPAK